VIARAVTAGRKMNIVTKVNAESKNESLERYNQDPDVEVEENIRKEVKKKRTNKVQTIASK
jgi:hypothetical protein